MNDDIEFSDPIVEEIRAIRAQIAEECGYDIRRIAEHASHMAAKVPGLKYITLEEIKQQKTEMKNAR